MQIVSTAWIDTSLAEFELSVGLTLHAAHGRASAEAPLRVVILNGFEKVTPAYAEHLAAGHVLITDGSALLAPWIERLPAIGRRVNRYETLCLLRWLVLREAMQGSAFLHIDLDLFPQPSHAALASALAGRTGVLGSPCFVAVSDRDWLETWCAEIEAFGRDPEATEARLLPSPGQGRIGSDQTLLGSLLRARILSRGDLGPLVMDYAAFDNPLMPRFRGAATPLVASRREASTISATGPCCSGTCRTISRNSSGNT